MSLELRGRPQDAVTVAVALQAGGERLADLQFTSSEPRSRTVICLPNQTNGQAYEAVLWSPESPHLIDARVTVTTGDGTVDEVFSYFGLRSVGWSDGHFMLNDRPYYVRPETYLAAPSADALKEEVQLIKDLGFNSVRIHQKVEDPHGSSIGRSGWGSWSGAGAPACTNFPTRPCSA
jgi:hypothetical protein